MIKHKKRPFLISSGFSLMELFVIIAITSIIASVSYSSIVPLYYKSQLNTAADILKQKLTSARFLSITQNRSIQYKIHKNKFCQRFSIKNIWQNWQCQKVDDGRIQYEMKGSITFSPSGFASPKTIYVRFKEYVVVLKVNINGSIREENKSG